MSGIRFKEAVNECSAALDAVPAYHKALVRRAKAYEQMGHFKQALSDIQKANKADTANPEIQVRPAVLQQTTAFGNMEGGNIWALSFNLDYFVSRLICFKGNFVRSSVSLGPHLLLGS